MSVTLIDTGFFLGAELTDKLMAFGAKFVADSNAALAARYPSLPPDRVEVKPGRVYTKVNISSGAGMSGRYMVENKTGIIYGIKGYGKVHKGHVYGTLDTINDYDWGSYYARLNDLATA